MTARVTYHCTICAAARDRAGKQWLLARVIGLAPYRPAPGLLFEEWVDEFAGDSDVHHICDENCARIALTRFRQHGALSEPTMISIRAWKHRAVVADDFPALPVFREKRFAIMPAKAVRA